MQPPSAQSHQQMAAADPSEDTRSVRLEPYVKTFLGTGAGWRPRTSFIGHLPARRPSRASISDSSLLCRARSTASARRHPTSRGRRTGRTYGSSADWSGEHFISRPFGCHLLITDATPSAPVALSESAEATIKSCRVSRCLCTTSSLSGDKCAFYTARAVRFCSLMSWLTGNHSSLPPRCFDVPYSFMFTEATNGILCAYVRKVRVWSVWSAGEHASFISPFDLGAGDTPTSESAIYRTGLIPL